MDCPKCHGEMKGVKIGVVEVDHCEGCGGMWFDVLEHEELKEMKNAGKLLDTGDAAQGKINNAEREIKCPKCEALMVGMTFHDQPHITYEMCSLCGGMYLDAGEFMDSTKLTLSETLRAIYKRAQNKK